MMNDGHILDRLNAVDERRVKEASAVVDPFTVRFTLNITVGTPLSDVSMKDS